MRTAMLLCLTLAFSLSTAARAQSVPPSSGCGACCLLSFYCCFGVPTASVDGMLGVLQGLDDMAATSESPAPATRGLTAMAF